MKIKVIEGSAPYIGGRICYIGKIQTVENAEDDVKHYLNQGTKILIEKDGNFINGNDYFDNTVELNNEDDNDSVIPFKDIFSGHWTKQVQKVEEYDDVAMVEQLLEYAKENDVSDGVIKRIKEHLETL